MSTGEVASTGTVMIAVLPIILGFQLLLNFLAFDMGNEPKTPIQPAPCRPNWRLSPRRTGARGRCARALAEPWAAISA